MDSTAFISRNDVQNVFRKTYNSQVFLGHTRYATHGTVKDKNAHPFQHDHIVLAHNGGIWNKDELLKGKDFDVDSEAICHSIAKIGVIETLKTIEGAFALSYYDLDEGKFNLIHNGGRPLSLFRNKTKNVWYYGSEGEMLFWLLRRNRIDHGVIDEIPESTLYSFDLASNSLETRKVDYERKKSYTKDYWSYTQHNTTEQVCLPRRTEEPQQPPANDTSTTTLLSYKEKQEGPHGRGLSYLGKWGLALGDVVQITMASHEIISHHTDFCKGLCYFNGWELAEADIWCYSFTEKQLKEFTKIKDNKYYSVISACWWDPKDGSYVVRLNGLFEEAPTGRKVVYPCDLSGVFTTKLKANLSGKTVEPSNEVVEEPDLLGIALAIAEDQAALQASYTKETEIPKLPDQIKVNENDSHLDNPEESEDTKEPLFVLGPAGSYIPHSHWLSLTKVGCGYCDCALVDPDDTQWVGDSPIHVECAARLGECY